MPTIFPPAVYETVDRIFYEHSQQLEQFVAEIEQEILPSLQHKTRFLDIGAGPALLSGRLAHHFQEVTVIEPNKEFVNKYPKGLFHVITKPFEECLLEQKYDFVLCSHVLYHVDLIKWPEFLKKLVGCVDKGGKALVIMLAPRGYNHEECLRLNPDYPNSRQVHNYLDEQKIPYSVIKVTCKLRTKNFYDMLQLVRFFMIEDCFTPDAYLKLTQPEIQRIDEELFRFAEERKVSSSCYELQYEEDHIVIAPHYY